VVAGVLIAFVAELAGEALVTLALNAAIGFGASTVALAAIGAAGRVDCTFSLLFVGAGHAFATRQIAVNNADSIVKFCAWVGVAEVVGAATLSIGGEARFYIAASTGLANKTLVAFTEGAIITHRTGPVAGAGIFQAGLIASADLLIIKSIARIAEAFGACFGGVALSLICFGAGVWRAGTVQRIGLDVVVTTDEK